jgi:hypothetical protein
MIFGEPRSGTTWLMELINHHHDIVVVWEPFHKKQGLMFSRINGGRAFISDVDHAAQLKNQFEDVVTLKKVNSWILNYASIQKLIFAKQSLTKVIRGNLILPWIIQSFNLRFKPIYIVRHPAATIISQLNGGLRPFEEMPENRTIQALYPAQSANYIGYITTLDSDLKKAMALWCLTNKYIFEHSLRNHWITVYYENLLGNPQTELTRIEQEWKRKIDVPIRYLRKASRTDFHDLLEQDHEIQLSKWRKYLSLKEILDLQQILDFFEIECYSMDFDKVIDL